MRSFLERHKCRLEVMTPLHIGSGRKLRKKEYIYDRAGARILVMDISRIYEYCVARKKTQEFESFFMGQDEANKSLRSFMLKAGLAESRFEAYSKYQLPAAASEMCDAKKAIALTDLLTFMRDPYGLPYVPGTSIKGMLRSALLAYELMRNPGKFSSLKAALENSARATGYASRTRFLHREMGDIETLAFKPSAPPPGHTGGKDDKDMHSQMSWISVSDSKPLRNADLALCKKHDVRTDGQKNSVNIFRECLRPGTKVEFDLTVDTEHCAYSIETVKEALSLMNTLIVRRFLNRFDQSALPEKEPVAWLGSAGFDTKTVIQALYGDLPVSARGGNEAVEITQSILFKTMSNKKFGDKKFKEHQHNLDISKFNASPHMRKETVYNGTLMDLGKARLVVLD